MTRYININKTQIFELYTNFLFSFRWYSGSSSRWDDKYGMIGLMMYQFHSKNFIVRPISAARPTSVTTKLSQTWICGRLIDKGYLSENSSQPKTVSYLPLTLRDNNIHT